MTVYKNLFLILSTVLFTSCVSDNTPTNAIYSNNYTASGLNENKASSSIAGKELTKDLVIETALENNPEYKASKLNAIAAESDYYEALSDLSPTVAAGSRGVTANYQAFSGLSTTMNALSVGADAKAALLDSENYRRLLEEKVVVDKNMIQKNYEDINIQKTNETFQKKMAADSLVKYKEGKATKSDILNFKIKALQAKAKTIEYEKEYKTNSIALAATMGLPNVELPDPEETENAVNVQNIENMPSLSEYLDLAIENRPDLKADKELLKSSEYALYAAWGGISPTVDIVSGKHDSAAVNSTISGGSKFANIRSHQAKVDIKKEALKRKWIEVIKNVRHEYISLKANLAIRDTYAASIKYAKNRRNHLEREFKKGNIDIAELNQAQSELVNVEKSLIKSEIGVSNAQAELCAACGIDLDELK